MKTLLYSIIFIVIFNSCEKEITVDLPNPEIKTVIEGGIETGGFPYVFVTQNAAYFNTFDSSVYVEMLDPNAIVIVGNGQEFDTLQIGFDMYTFPFLKYTGSKFVGEVGKTYTLKVISRGRTHEANSYIPQPITLDSLKFKPEKNEDTLGYVWLYLKDPPTVPNYYRIFTKVLGKDSVFLHPFPSVTDDRYFDGINAEYSLFRGRNPLEDSQYDDDGNDADGVPRFYFRSSETVVVKLCAIDVSHYQFWYSIEQQFMTDGNPFASPVSVQSNISNNALGVWGGYGIFIDTINIPQSLQNNKGY